MKQNYELHQGNCLEALKKMPDNSVDSVVCDPPYGLSFMGKKWDYDVPSQEIWAECLRVLKPGGHLLAFAGTRTQHRMAVRIEDAGFEIRDMIAWVYGCYSEDTECLTKDGWKNYTQLSKNDFVMQWDSTTGTPTWVNPSDIYIYDAPKTMVNFSNRHTNQLLTENHRVYLKHKTNSRYTYGEFDVVEAGAVKKSWLKVFPLAAKLHDGVKVESAYLVGWWMTDAWLHGDGKACMFSQSKPKTMQKLISALEKSDCKFSEYVKKARKETHQDEHTFYVTGNLADYLISNFKDRSINYDVLSWDYDSRFNLLEGMLDGDGTRNEDQHSETFWSKKSDRLDVVSALCTSLGFRNHIDYNKGCVYLNRTKNSTEFQSKHKVETVDYSGSKVWCLKTETGAFVVRRNGKPFISGNSGFPKSHDVSKAIDKAAPRVGLFDAFAEHFSAQLKASGKAQKEVAALFPSKTGGLTGCVWNWANGANVPTRAQWEVLAPLLSLSPEWLPLIERIEAERDVIGQKSVGIKNGAAGGSHEYGLTATEVNITAPATEAAKQWQGWGTALKPALEPITVARKPLVGTVAGNVLEHGTGGLNIDACRVSTDDKLVAGGSLRTNSGDTRDGKALGMFQDGTPNTFTQNDQGRWPANLILDGSDEVLAGFPETQSGARKAGQGGNGGGGSVSFRNAVNSNDFAADKGSAARFFKQVSHDTEDMETAKRFMYCAKASKRDRDEGLEGFAEKKAVKQFNEGMEGKIRSDGSVIKEAIKHKNNHPTVKPTDLMRYLCRLVTPPGGTVLDPFMGSGSTGKAAMLEGFNFIGCELSPEYMEIAKARIQAAKDKSS